MSGFDSAEHTSVVRMTGIVKRFGAVMALEGANLELRPGTMHAVVGENGAGKSTLVKILYGSLQPDDGEVLLDGTAVEFRSSADALAKGIGMVSQHYGIIPELTCLENLVLGAEHGAMLSRRTLTAEAESLGVRLGFRVNWSRPAGDLTPSDAQRLEILKLLWRKARVLILDEPTATLSPLESKALFENLQQMVQEGRSVILVTHRISEVLRYCQVVTVLRRGKPAGFSAVDGLSAADLSRMMVGEALEDLPEPSPAEVGARAVYVRSLRVSDRSRGEVLRAIDLDVHAGEVVGIAGVEGSGQRELLQVLSGQLAPSSGVVEVLGHSQTLRTAALLQSGLRLLPDDRHRDAMVEEWSLEENAALGLQRNSDLRRGPWVSSENRIQLAASFADRFGTLHGGLNMPIASLSGGNQQRFVAARALGLAPKLILAVQPARGLDVRGTRDVFAGIREECGKGAAAIIVGFDLDELLAHCDRIAVMLGGALQLPPKGMERDREWIGRMMVGAA